MNYYIDGLFLPADLSPELDRLVGDALTTRAVSGRLRDWLRELDYTARIQKRDARPPVTDPYAGWHGVDEAASLLDVTPRQVRRRCETGKLAAVKVAGRVWKIAPRAVEQLSKKKTPDYRHDVEWGFAMLDALGDEDDIAAA